MDEGTEYRSLFSAPNNVMTVVRIQLDKQINLSKLARKTINSHYNKGRFAACIVRTELGCGLFFSGGTIVITFGHVDLRERVEKLYMGMVHAIDPSSQQKFSRMENSSVACSVKAKIFLNLVRRASLNDRREVKFCPELFPGLTKYITIGENDNVSLVLFCSGKYNIVGCKSKQEIEEAYEYSVKFLRPFIKIPPTNANTAGSGDAVEKNAKRRRLLQT